jgi:hypothetical protein
MVLYSHPRSSTLNWNNWIILGVFLALLSSCQGQGHLQVHKNDIGGHFHKTKTYLRAGLLLGEQVKLMQSRKLVDKPAETNEEGGATTIEKKDKVGFEVEIEIESKPEGLENEPENEREETAKESSTTEEEIIEEEATTEETAEQTEEEESSTNVEDHGEEKKTSMDDVYEEIKEERVENEAREANKKTSTRKSDEPVGEGTEADTKKADNLRDETGESNEKDNGIMKDTDDELEEETAELEAALVHEEKVARGLGGLGLFLAIFAMIITAHQMSENPDGIFARYVFKLGFGTRVYYFCRVFALTHKCLSLS